MREPPEQGVLSLLTRHPHNRGGWGKVGSDWYGLPSSGEPPRHHKYCASRRRVLDSDGRSARSPTRSRRVRRLAGGSAPRRAALQAAAWPGGYV